LLTSFSAVQSLLARNRTTIWSLFADLASTFWGSKDDRLRSARRNPEIKFNNQFGPMHSGKRHVVLAFKILRLLIDTTCLKFFGCCPFWSRLNQK